MEHKKSQEFIGWVKESVSKESEFQINKDEQFYFLIGQVTAFIINQAGNKTATSVVRNNILLNARDSKRLKELIIQYYTRTCGDITLRGDLPFNRAFAEVLGWNPEIELDKCKEIFMMGLVTQNLLSN